MGPLRIGRSVGVVPGWSDAAAMSAILSPAVAVHRSALVESFELPDEELFQALRSRLHLFRRRLRARDHLFRAGQPMQSIHLVHAGYFRTSILSPDGREKVTGFRARGELLGLDSLGTGTHACDAVALELGEVWDIPCARVDEVAEVVPGFHDRLTAAMSAEIRRDWKWMLNLGTLNAEQRVAAFLLDLGERQSMLGYSARQLVLRMTRADLGSFLALQLETVTRALSLLAARRVIEVDRREVRIIEPDVLQRMACGAKAH